MKKHQKNQTAGFWLGLHRRQKLAAVFVCILVIGLLCGCGQKKTNIVFTTGLGSKDLFKIKDEVCTISEAKLVLYNVSKQYAVTFGSNNWNQKFGEKGTLSDYVKQQTVKELSQIKSLCLLAEKYQVQLDKKEEDFVSQAAVEYEASIPAEYKNGCRLEKGQVNRLMKQYLLSKKVCNKISSEVNAEISDDEARIIIIQHILFKTTGQDENGQEIKLTEAAKNDLNTRAYQVWTRIGNGESFEALAGEFSQDKTILHTIGRGEMSDEFDKHAFALKSGELGPVFEDKEGIHIVKCISNYEKADTEKNKTTIYEKRCRELLNKRYDDYMEKVAEEFNNKLWNKVELLDTADFPEQNIWSKLDTYEFK